MNLGESELRFASEPVVADLDGDGDAEVVFTTWTANGSNAGGDLFVVDALGNELQRVALPRSAQTWDGALAAPTLARLDADANLEVVVNTAHTGLVAYEIPGTANARLLWPTGRGNIARTAPEAGRGRRSRGARRTRRTRPTPRGVTTRPRAARHGACSLVASMGAKRGTAVHSIRSVLFVGRAERLHAEGVAESPWLDFAWARDAEEAVQLPLSAFDALIVDATDERVARESVTRLRGAGRGACPPILVRLPATSTTSEVVLRSAGAAAVCRGDATPLCDALGALAGETAQRPDAAEPPRTGLIARSAAMRDVLALAERAMGSSATVLLSGETGTGKEVLARAIHDGSARRRAAFVARQLRRLPRDAARERALRAHARLVHRRRPRTSRGSSKRRRPRHALPRRDRRDLGVRSRRSCCARCRSARCGRSAERSRARSTCASSRRRNRALPREVATGRFREDLYYRLAVFRIALPPLRERADDVLPLAAHFLRRHGAREGKPGCQLSREAADLLLAHTWPGNVRELENEMQRALALAEPGEAIAVRHLSDRLQETLRPARRGRAPRRARIAARTARARSRPGCCAAPSKPTPAAAPRPRARSGSRARGSTRRCGASGSSEARSIRIREGAARPTHHALRTRATPNAIAPAEQARRRRPRAR